MTRWFLVAALAALSLVVGCKQPTEQPAVKPPAREEPQIAAIRPADGTQGVSLAPDFRWRVPGELQPLAFESFHLAEVGGPTETGEDQGTEIAYASGLHDTSPTELNPFQPPPEVILTGALRDMKQLKPETWYRWTVVALGPSSKAKGVFFFRTGKGR